MLNRLLEDIGDDDRHPLYGLLDTLGTLVHAYEERHDAMPRVAGVHVLHDLLPEHNLTQSELPEVGSQGVVSEILSGKRKLNMRQIHVLSERFGVSPAAFL